MARGDTFKKRDNSFLADKMNFELDGNDLEAINPAPETISQEETVTSAPTTDQKLDIDLDIDSLPKKKSTANEATHRSIGNQEKEIESKIDTKKKPSKRPNVLAFMSETERVVAKTFKIREDVVEAFDSLFEDSRGKKIPGVRGMMSKVATNALIKELVELGALDPEYLDKLEEY